MYEQQIITMTTDKRNHNRQDLRVLCKNMVYCSGLPSNLTKDELASQSYFGQYGKIQKIVVNVFPNRNYCSVYLTFSHQFEAAIAILACNQFSISRSTLYCLFGTTKYCKYFLKKIECKNLASCPYVHAFDGKNQIQIQNSPAEAYPQHEKLAKLVLQKYPQKIAHIKKQNKRGGQLPEPLYAVDLIQEQNLIAENEKNKQNITNTDRDKDRERNNKQIQIDNSTKNTIIDQQKQIKVQEQEIQEKQEKQEIPIDIEQRIKKMILKQLEKVKGSRLLGQIREQQKNVKHILVTGLLD